MSHADDAPHNHVPADASADKVARLHALADELSHTAHTNNSFNPYYAGCPNGPLRLANLKAHLRNLLQHDATPPMLILEAPGYRGCRLTGLPVTSRKLIRLAQQADASDVLTESIYPPFLARDVVMTEEDGFDDVRGEQSATILWTIMHELDTVPFIWNACPFHPHKPDQPRTNRKPRRPELDAGQVFLRRMIDIVQPDVLVGVGRVAQDSLRRIGYADVAQVRHPAQGGKNAFVAGMRALFAAGEQGPTGASAQMIC